VWSQVLNDLPTDRKTQKFDYYTHRFGVTKKESLRQGRSEPWDRLGATKTRFGNGQTIPRWRRSETVADSAF